MSLSAINAEGIKTLIHGAFHLTSDNPNLHKEFVFLVRFFISNLYPCFLIYTLIKRFQYTLFNPIVFPSSNPKLYLIIKLPFYDHTYLNLKNTVVKLLQTRYPNLKFIFIVTCIHL